MARPCSHERLGRTATILLALLSLSQNGCGDDPTGPNPHDGIGLPLAPGAAWHYSVHHEWHSESWPYGDEETFDRRDSVDAVETIGAHRFHRLLKTRVAASPGAADTLLLRERSDSIFFLVPSYAREIARMRPDTTGGPWLLFAPSMQVGNVRTIADGGWAEAPGESVHVSLSVVRRPAGPVSVPYGDFGALESCEYQYRYTLFLGGSPRSESTDRVQFYLLEHVGVVAENGSWSYLWSHWWRRPLSGVPAEGGSGSWTASLTAFVPAR
jgi:hypothetical protein